MNRTLTAVEGLSVGHAQHHKVRTGCTVVLFDRMAPVACEARGGYPTTYDTHGIDVAKRFIERHAIFLAGGDVYGLDSATGIRRYLLERGEASMRAGGQMPLIVGATIYDMWRADIESVSYGDLAHTACTKASTKPVVEGEVGAGTGGTVGGFLGHNSGSRGGLGSWAMRMPGGVVVAALAVTNSMGNIYNPSNGKVIAGSRGRDGRFIEFDEAIEKYIRREETKENTTLGIVATNAELSHEELLKVSQMAHDGLAMSIRPTHTTGDGDTIFVASTGKVRLKETRYRMIDTLGYMAARCVSQSIVRSVRGSGPVT